MKRPVITFEHVAEAAAIYISDSRSASTIAARRLDIRIFAEFVESTIGKDFASFGRADWTCDLSVQFIERRRTLDSANTLHRRVASIKALANRVDWKSASYLNPMASISLPQLREGTASVLSRSDIRRIRIANVRYIGGARPSHEAFRLISAWCIFELILRTGLRPCEVSSLRMDQLDHLLRWLSEVPSSGWAFSLVSVHSDMRPLLHYYLTQRSKELARRGLLREDFRTEGEFPIFVSTYDADLSDAPRSLRVSQKTLWRWLSMLSSHEAARGVSARTLRDTFGYHAYIKCSDVEEVRKALRFRSSRMSSSRVIRRYAGIGTE